MFCVEFEYLSVVWRFVVLVEDGKNTVDVGGGLSINTACVALETVTWSTSGAVYRAVFYCHDYFSAKGLELQLAILTSIHFANPGMLNYIDRLNS